MAYRINHRSLNDTHGTAVEIKAAVLISIAMR
jgi:hypothetical protein